MRDEQGSTKRRTKSHREMIYGIREALSSCFRVFGM